MMRRYGRVTNGEQALDMETWRAASTDGASMTTARAEGHRLQSALALTPESVAPRAGFKHTLKSSRPAGGE